MIRRAVSVTAACSAVSTAAAARTYMPIYAPDAPTDNMHDSRMQGQLTTLWGPTEPRIPNTSAGVDFLRRCGINPTVEQLKQQQDSIFSKRSEDYFGTNLMRPSSKEHAADSQSYWLSYYEKKYLTMMRMFRRTSTSIIGIADGKEHLTDEADFPETVWANDSYFREVAFMSANFLQAHVTSLEEFEQKFKACNAEQFMNFIKAYRYQTITLAPLPTAACWSFEGEQLTKWVNMWKPLQLEALNTFIPMMQDAATTHTWAVVADKIATAYEKIFAIRTTREARQIAAGVRKAWADMTADERLAAGCAVIDRKYKGLVDGTFDAPHVGDDSAEWKAEHEAIEKILNEDIGVGFTLNDFWTHVVRVGELEHEHLYASHSFKVLQGRAYEQTRMDCNNGDAANYYKELAETFRHSKFDAKNGVYIPHTGPVWCRLNWVKFGAATITHHTAAARRQLLFHHHSLRGVHALASLYYKLQPLSGSLDYSTPYRYRQSYVAACAEYGAEMAQADHYYNVSGLTQLGCAEEAMGIVTEAVKLNYGAHRRQLCRATFAKNQPTLPATNPVATIVPLTSSTADAPAASTPAAKEKWAFGGKRTIKYNYSSPHIADLSKNPFSGAEGVLYSQQTARKGSVQVTLMRKSTAELKKSKNVVARYLNGEAAGLIKQNPELKDVRDDAIRFCEMLMGGTNIDASKVVEEPSYVNPTDKSEWEYVTTIADNLPLSQAQTIDVTLPYANIPAFSVTEKALLQGGEYCLRLRFIDNMANPSRDPTRVTEAWTPAFEAEDKLAAAIAKALSIPADALTTALSKKNLAAAANDVDGIAKLERTLAVDGAKLIPLCSALRAAGIEVPLQVEFNAGQVLNTKGQFYIDVLVDLLREGKFGAAKVLNDGLTDVQLNLEDKIRSHWRLCTFVGADEDEWFTVRRHVLDDAMANEAEWWRADDWLETEMEDTTTIASRERYADQVCTLLSARSDNGGYDIRRMCGLIGNDGKDARGVRVVETSASISGEGVVTSLAFDNHTVREQQLSVDDLLANAQTAIKSAHLRLNTLAGRKRHTFCKNKIITTYSEGSQTVFGGKYGKTAQFALGKAVEEAALTAPLLNPAEALRGLKPVDRFASDDNPDLRFNTWQKAQNRHGLYEDINVPEHNSSWGV